LRSARVRWQQAPGPGRTGVDAGLLERVLGEEARGPRRRRVWLDTATGEYRLVRGRFDPDVLEALALLEP
jgi:hypothetical protein